MKPLKDEYRVIIWGLGSVGRSALQIINAKQSLRLVAAYDIDPKKIGRDAGEVCGFEPAGVIVTNDREAVLNTEADICLYYAASVWDEGCGRACRPEHLQSRGGGGSRERGGCVRETADAVPPSG